MSVSTTCRLTDPFGTFLKEIGNFGVPGSNGNGLTYTINCTPGAIGVLELTLPTNFDPNLLLIDGRIYVYRSIDGRAPYRDGNACFVIRYIEFGPDYILVRAYHATSLLSRRIIAYDNSSAYANKASAPADNIMKAFVRENMLSLISGTDRDGVETYADVSSYLTCQVDQSLSPNVSITASRRNLLETLTDIANASSTAGTYLTFEILALTEVLLEFRTYTSQVGVDRRQANTAGNNPVILGTSRGNLENARLIYDWSDAYTFVSAGGTGSSSDRVIGTAIDLSKAAETPFGRYEVYADASNVATQSDADAAAASALYSARPRIYVTGDLVETRGFTRGIDFDRGDLITVENPYTFRQFSARIDIIQETLSADGKKAGIGVRSI